MALVLLLLQFLGLLLGNPHAVVACGAAKSNSLKGVFAVVLEVSPGAPPAGFAGG